MFELAAEHYASLTPLFGSQYVGAEVAGAVLAGNTQGKVFVSAPDDFRTAFVYDNGFCVLGGPVATPEFAKSCLQWLYDHLHRRQSNFAEFLRPDTLSSTSSDFSVNPRKLFSSSRHQAADICLLQGQRHGYFPVRKSLLF